MNDPQLGIWWDNGVIIAKFSHSPTQDTTRIANRLDSNLTHVDLWSKAAGKLKTNPRNEYFSVPRGRVLLDAQNSTGIILHGPATSIERLRMIAELFGLSTWRSEQDCHYFMGTDADSLFMDDDD
jgi:hypothetical protein